MFSMACYKQNEKKMHAKWARFLSLTSVNRDNKLSLFALLR